MQIDDFIEAYRQEIISLMQYKGIFSPDQEAMEDFISNTEELYRLAMKEGVDI